MYINIYEYIYEHIYIYENRYNKSLVLTWEIFLYKSKLWNGLRFEEFLFQLVLVHLGSYNKNSIG